MIRLLVNTFTGVTAALNFGRGRLALVRDKVLEPSMMARRSGQRFVSESVGSTIPRTARRWLVVGVLMPATATACWETKWWELVQAAGNPGAAARRVARFT